MTEDAPKVFQPGTVTLVLGPAGVRAYVGATEITMVGSVKVDLDEVQIFTRKPNTEAEHLRLDEEVRVARSCGLVKVRRG